VQAREVTGIVTYAAWRTLYIDAGRVHGITAELDGLLYRDNSLLGEIRVAAIAESSCVATMSGDSVIAMIGDRAVFVFEDAATASQSSPEQVAQLNSDTAPRQVKARPKRAPRFSGRISVQADYYDDRSGGSGSYVTPGLSTRTTVSSIAGNHSELRVKYRARKLSPDAGGEWQHRLYEASLNFGAKESRLQGNLGRIQAASIAGIGYVDGAYGEVVIANGLSVGGFAGAQAELDLNRSDWSSAKYGVLTTYRREKGTSSRTQATLAVAGDYQQGHINREFIYQQFTHTVGGALSLYESSDFNVNRGWKHEAEGSTITLANVLVNARYSPAQAVTLTGGYDGRSRYYTWETRETPDSLFHDAIRHGVRAGIELNVWSGARLSAQQTYRSEPQTNRFYPSRAFSLASNTLLQGRLGGMLRYNTFENLYSTGIQQAGSVSFTATRGLDFRTEYGTTRYHFESHDYSSESDWLRLSADFNTRNGWFGSVSAERNYGSGEDVYRGLLDLGVRIK